VTSNGKNGSSAAEGAIDSAATRARTEALYREHGPTVLRICRALLRNRAEAEDATQQVFLSAHRALLNGMVPYRPAAWLATIARRECWARIRTETSALPPEAVDALDSDLAADALRRAELTVMWTAIAELPSMQRDAFLLREIRGLSYGQLEQQLARSGPSVRSLLGRARRRLRLRLQDVHTALGGVPWLEPVARLVAGGSNPAAPAVRAAAIGLGAAALAGGAVVTPTVLEHRVRAPSAHAAPPSSIHSTRRAAAHVAPAAPRAAVSTHRGPSRGRQTDDGRVEVRNRSEHEGGSDAGSSGSGDHGEDSHGGSDELSGSGESRGSGSGSGASGGSGRG